MRIAFIRKRYSPYGGAELYLQNLMERLKSAGNEIHIFANSWQGEAEGIQFHYIPVIKGLSFLEVLSFACRAKDAVAPFKFDVIYSFERTFCRGVIYRAGDGCHREYLNMRSIQSCRFKRSIMRINPLHRSILYIERKMFSPGFLRAIVTNSERSKAEINRHYNVPVEKIRVIYNGVDTVRFHPGLKDLYRAAERKRMNISDDTPVLLFAGSGFERKGLAYLIKGLSLVPAGRDIKLLVAGSGRINAYQSLARRLQLEEKVSFLGPCPEMEKLYAMADIFVLPSIYEPFSNACLEAMACGLPVVTSGQNGASELLTGGLKELILNDPSSPLEIAKIICLLLDKHLRIKLGLECRKVAETLTWGKSIDETLSLIERVK